MRVAYVSADAGVPVFGTKGCSIHVQEIIRAIQRRGDEVSLFATRLGGSPSRDLSPRIHDFSIPSASEVAEREESQMIAAHRIASAIEGSEQSFDMIYERYSLWSAATMQMAERLGLPSVLEVNAPLIEEQLAHREIVHRDEATRIRGDVFAAAGTIIAVSEAVANYVRRHVADSDQNKIHVVPNGVDVDRFAPAPHRNESSPFTVGFLGTLKPWHGLESLIAAFERVFHQVPHCRLRIIGDGPLREELQQSIQTQTPHMASAIEWMGAIAPERVPEELGRLDVAVAPYGDTADFYFSPLKVFEYMAAGLPVVAGSIGQLRAILVDQVNGCLYPPGDHAALADILIALANDPSKRLRLGDAAREASVARHSWSSALSRILKAVSRDQKTHLVSP